MVDVLVMNDGMHVGCRIRRRLSICRMQLRFIGKLEVSTVLVFTKRFSELLVYIGTTYVSLGFSDVERSDISM